MAAARRGRPPAVAVAAWWHSLRPGEYFEVEYTDDEVAHERCPLWPLTPDAWVVRSPDGDEWIEHLDGLDPATGPTLARPMRAGRQPAAMKPLYRFRERLDNRTLKTAMGRALRLVLTTSTLEATPLVTEIIDEDGDPITLIEACGATLAEDLKRAVERAHAEPAAGALVVAGGPPDPAAAPVVGVGATAAVAGDSPATHVWLACVRGPSVALGK